MTTTIDPASSTELARITTEVGESLEALKGLRIESAEEIAGYSEILTDVIKRRQELETIRKGATKPMLDDLAAVRALFTPAETVCKEIEEIIKGAIMEFRTRMAGTAAMSRAALQGAKDATETATELAKVAGAEAALDDTQGPTTTRKTWTFTVADEASVPREWLKVDEDKIKAAIKSGTREIPGVIIHQETKTVMKRTPRAKPEAT